MANQSSGDELHALETRTTRSDLLRRVKELEAALNHIARACERQVGDPGWRQGWISASWVMHHARWALGEVPTWPPYPADNPGRDERDIPPTGRTGVAQR